VPRFHLLPLCLDCARPCFIFAELLVVFFLFFDLVLFVLSHSLCRKGLSGAAGGRSWLGDGWSWPEGRRRGQPRARGRCPRGFGRARPYSWAELAAGTNDTELAATRRVPRPCGLGGARRRSWAELAAGVDSARVAVRLASGRSTLAELEDHADSTEIASSPAWSSPH